MKINSSDFIDKAELLKALGDIKNALKDLETQSRAYQDSIADGLRNISQAKAGLANEVKKAQATMNGINAENTQNIKLSRELVAEIERLVKGYQEQSKAKKGVKDAGDAVAGSLADLKKRYSELTKEAANINVETEEGAKLFKAISGETSHLKDRINDLNKTLNQHNGSMNIVKGSYNDLVARNKELAQIIRNSGGAFDKNNEKLNALKKEFADNTQKLKDFDAQMNQHFRNVGNYGSALDGLVGGFGQLNNALSIVGLATVSLEALIGLASEINQTASEINNLRSEIQLLTGATGEDLDKTTSKVRAISQVYGVDYQELLTNTNNLAKQFGISQSEAFDLVQKGFEQGANATGDFLNKIREYPAQFKASGLSAEDFIKVATQEVRGGVFDDKLLDSVKELGLRLREMTPTQIAALEQAFSKDFVKRFQDVAKSGASVPELLKMIESESKTAGLSVQQMQTLIADLGGGPVEDIGGLVEVMRQLGEAEKINLDATTEANAARKEQLTLTENLAKEQNTFAKSVKPIQDAFASAWLVIQKFFYQGLNWIFSQGKGVVDWFARVGEKLNLWRIALVPLKITWYAVTGALQVAYTVISGLLTVVGTIIEYIADWVQWLGRVTGAFEAAEAAFSWINGAIESVQKFGKGIASWAGSLFNFASSAKASKQAMAEMEAEAKSNEAFFQSFNRITGKVVDNLKNGFNQAKDGVVKGFNFMKDAATGFAERMGWVKESQEQSAAATEAQNQALAEQATEVAALQKAHNDLLRFRIDQQLKSIDALIEAEDGYNADVLRKRAELKAKLADIDLNEALKDAKFAPEIELAKEKFTAQIAEIEAEMREGFQGIPALESGLLPLPDPETFRQQADTELDILAENLRKQKELKDRAAEQDEERQELLNEKLKELGQEVYDFSVGLINQAFESKIQRYENEITALEEQTERELELYEGNDQAQAFIQEEADRKRKELEEKIKQEKLKQFRFDKALRAGNVVGDTAAAIVKTLATTPLPGGLPFIISTAAIGAVQLAQILAQKPPQFAKGKERVTGPGTETSDSIWAKLSLNERIMTAEQNRRIGFDVPNEELVKAWEFYDRSRAMAGDWEGFQNQTRQLAMARQQQEQSERLSQQMLLDLISQSREEATTEAFRVFAKLQKETAGNTDETAREVKRLRQAIVAKDRYKM